MDLTLLHIFAINSVSLKKVSLYLFLFLFSLSPMQAMGFELGIGVRSVGFTLEAGHKFSDNFNARLGLSQFESRDNGNANVAEIPSLNDIIFSQSANIELSHSSILIDYHPWQGDFRFTIGITDNKIILDVVNFGDDKFVINDRVYSDKVLESTDLRLQLTDGISPYFGFGWATGFDKEKGFSFNGDIGFYYAVNFDIEFSANCIKYVSQLKCANAKRNAKKEELNLKSDNELFYLPMIGIGFSYKF
ncbi:MAG: hypothetical protein P8I13_04275 [Porticoccaceae bacterium]|nr:hypothetical protein [Porticoccaceae bacterium]